MSSGCHLDCDPQQCQGALCPYRLPLCSLLPLAPGSRSPPPRQCQAALCLRVAILLNPDGASAASYSLRHGSYRMTLSKRTALGISLGVIVLYWIYQIVSQHPDARLPAHFSEFVWRIVRTKLFVFAAIFLLLRLEGERFGGIGVNGLQWPKHLGIGLFFGVAMFIALNVMLGSALGSLLPRPAANGPTIMSFFKEPANLLAWI